jgi:hypothetical protein
MAEEKNPNRGRITRKSETRKIALRASGHIQITDRDVEILGWVATHGVVTVAQIARRFFPPASGLSAAQRRVRKLCHADPPLLSSTRTFWKQPPVIRVTRPGADLADVGLNPAHLVLAEVHHALAVVDLAEQTLPRLPGSTVETERQLRAARLRERREGKRKATGRIPDFQLHLLAGPGVRAELIAVELDLSPKREATIAAIVRAYQGARVDGVWWYVLPRRVAHMTDIIKRLRADDFIEVRSWHL